MERLSFSNISYHQLTSLVAIREEVDDSQFNGWLVHDPTTDFETNEFLLSLASRHRKNIDGYSEEEVKAKLIIPMLNRIDFTVGPYTDWYERPLAASIGGVEIAGIVDYLVARGEKEPTTPYFFIQEFKPQYPNRSPEVQLISEMLVAMTLSRELNELRGAYVHGSVWKFVLLRRVEVSYVYYVSPILDLFRMPDARSIYVALTNIREQLVLESRSQLLEARSGGTLQGCSVESQQHATLGVDIQKLSQDTGIRGFYGLEKELT